MPKVLHNDVFDKGLEQISNTANWGGGVLNCVVTVGVPANSTEASTIYPAGKRISDVIAMAGGNFALADRVGGGREITIAAKAGTAQVNVPALESGTATAGGANTLTDTGKAWGADVYAGKMVKITAGTGVGQLRRITTNSATVLAVETNWTINPDVTSVYEILQDLHVAMYDGGGAPRVLSVADVSSDQVIVSGNPINLAAYKIGYPDPV